MCEVGNANKYMGQKKGLKYNNTFYIICLLLDINSTVHILKTSTSVSPPPCFPQNQAVPPPVLPCNMNEPHFVVPFFFFIMDKSR